MIGVWVVGVVFVDLGEVVDLFVEVVVVCVEEGGVGYLV